MHSDSPTAAEPTTENVLVVLDADDPDATLRAVEPELSASDGALHLLLVFPMAEYAARRRARIDADVPGPYTVEHLSGEARRIARRVGREYLDPGGFEAMGAVGGRCDCVRSAVDRGDYSRIYVVDPPRKRWHRLLGVEDLSTEIARVLPDAISVIPLLAWSFRVPAGRMAKFLAPVAERPAPLGDPPDASGETTGPE